MVEDKKDIPLYLQDFPKGKHPNSIKNLKPVKPGEIRNPHGSNGAQKHFTKKILADVIEMALMGNLESLKAVVRDPDAPALQVGVAKCLAEAIMRGDWSTIEKIIERILGKIPIAMDHTSRGESIAPRVLITLPDNGRSAPKEFIESNCRKLEDQSDDG